MVVMVLKIQRSLAKKIFLVVMAVQQLLKAALLVDAVQAFTVQVLFLIIFLHPMTQKA
jgi:hypothetical protein